MSVKVPGARLEIFPVGSGPSRIVVLHGGPGASHGYLRPQLDALARSHRTLVYYDQRGSGGSLLDEGAPPGTASDHVADLEALRAHLGEDRLTLLGYSWGGLLALLYALEHPGRVGRMVLVSPAPTRVADLAAMRTRLDRAAERLEINDLRATLDRSSPAAERRARFQLAVAKYFYDPLKTAELTPFVVQTRAETAVWQSLGDYDLTERLKALRIPTLIVHGREDPIPIESARRTAAALSAELVELSPCGHVPYIEQPIKTLAAIETFLGVT